MYFTLDRFEENFAVFVSDDEKTQNYDRKLFENCREGDVFENTDGKLVFSESETQKRREYNKTLMKKLFSKNRT